MCRPILWEIEIERERTIPGGRIDKSRLDANARDRFLLRQRDQRRRREQREERGNLV